MHIRVSNAIVNLEPPRRVVECTPKAAVTLSEIRFQVFSSTLTQRTFVEVLYTGKNYLQSRMLWYWQLKGLIIGSGHPHTQPSLVDKSA